MRKDMLLSWLVVFAVWMAGSYVVHETLLHDDYARLASLFRPESDAQRYFPFMILAHVLMAGAFVWIYSRGAEARPWVGQGVRFGLAVALLTVVPTYMIYFAVQPMPGATVAKQILFDGILVILLGVITAAIQRRPATS